MANKAFVGVGVAVVAAAVFGYMQSQNGAALTAQDAETALFASMETPEQTALYETLKVGYPVEYAQFLQEMADFANSDTADAGGDEAAFALGQNFTNVLRQDNAQYLGTAPLSAFETMRGGQVDLLQSMSDDPNLCARMALMGGAGLTMDDLPDIDMDLMVATSRNTFEAMIAGRDSPVQHEDASQSDIRDVVDMWQLSDGVTPDMIAAFFANNVDNPNTCAAHLSFERFLNASDDPKVQRVAIYLTRLAAGL